MVGPKVNCTTESTLSNGMEEEGKKTEKLAPKKKNIGEKVKICAENERKPTALNPTFRFMTVEQ